MCYQRFDCEATNHTDFRVFYGNTVHVLNRKPCESRVRASASAARDSKRLNDSLVSIVSFCRTTIINRSCLETNSGLAYSRFKPAAVAFSLLWSKKSGGSWQQAAINLQ